MTALALSRFVHFIAAMLAFGASAFLRFYAPAGLRRALTPPSRRLVTTAGLIALVSALVWLMALTASTADEASAAIDPQAIADVLMETAFGRAFGVHLVLTAAFAAAVVFGPRDNWTALAALAGLMLASLGLVGHAAMQTGALGLLHRANHALHLLAAGAWIGALIPFVLTLDASRTPALRPDAVTAMQRFSFTGHFVVAAIVATGFANIALTSGHAPLPPTTPYRALLIVKIGLVGVMIGLAIANRYVLVPRLRGGAHAARPLRALSLVNVGLGAAVVALTSVFALFDPA